MKRKTLREKIRCIPVRGFEGSETKNQMDEYGITRVLRLVREEQRKKCGECGYRQKIEDGYVH